jgi:hypothetical protein
MVVHVPEVGVSKSSKGYHPTGDWQWQSGHETDIGKRTQLPLFGEVVLVAPLPFDSLAPTSDSHTWLLTQSPAALAQFEA